MTFCETGKGNMQQAPTSGVSNPSLEELLEFERLLSELSVRFANVPGDQVVAAIESALTQLVRFLGFDRSAFWEFINEEQQHFLCSVAVEGVEPIIGVCDEFLALGRSLAVMTEARIALTDQASPLR